MYQSPNIGISCGEFQRRKNPETVKNMPSLFFRVKKMN